MKLEHWTKEQEEVIRRWRGIKTYADIGEMIGRTARATKAHASRKFGKTLDVKLKESKLEPSTEGSVYEQGEDFINVVCASNRMLSKEDVIKQFQIDLEIWEIERFRVKTSEGYRKDRKVDWHVSEGCVTKGDVEDSGKMLVVPLYHIEVRLVRKKVESRAKEAIDALVEKAGKFAPKYPSIKYSPKRDGFLYEIAMPDIHFGRLCWGEESGENYDIQISRRAVLSVADQLLGYSTAYGISRILLPVGNDFFNSDTLTNTTTRGTPQQEDVRWQKTFQRGCELAIALIDKCAAVARVDVAIIPGNHDSQRAFFLGEALKFWYRNCKNVVIDNSPKTRKYYTFGKCLIGFAHGYSERLSNLPLLMATEEPGLWAGSQFREWHTGDKHHKKDMVTTADEDRGVMVRILRSLVPADAWTFNSGFVKPLKAAESFLWHPEKGLVAQFTASPEV